jgi:hypothetical protein
LAFPLFTFFFIHVLHSNQVFTDRIPFDYIRNDLKVIYALYKGHRPRPCPEISSDIWAAMEQCWKKVPKERPSAFALSVLLNVISGLRRGNMKPLSISQVVDILEVVDKRADGSPSGSSCRRQSKQLLAPYECYWPWCHIQFPGLVECQDHLVHHVL